MPKVSILVPIYNVEKYLRECLESLLNQTLQDIEIICINDGSTDNSLEIIKEYVNKDSRFKLIDKANSGYGISMNMGLEAATGEYIGIVESDDFANLNMFENLYKLAKKNNLDVIKSDWNLYWTNGQTIKAGAIKKSKCNKVINIDRYKEILNIIPSIWSAIYKKEFLVENNIKFNETAGASYQDTGFDFKTKLTAKSLMLVNDAYVNYRQDNPNSSVKSSAKAYAVCIEFESIEKYMKENGLLTHLEYFYSIMFKAYRNNLLRLDKSLTKDFIEKYSETFKRITKEENLGKLFYSRCKEKEVKILTTNTKKYYALYRTKKFADKFRKARRKIISIKIENSRFSCKLFGKEIIKIG